MSPEVAPQRARAGGRFTLSNGITLVRLVSIPFFVAALLGGRFRTASALFWLAVATDVLDGRIARARGESSALGGLLDHGSDALFVVTGLAALAWAGRVTALLPGLVAIAFVQYVVDSRTIAGRPLRASSLGRWNGIGYFVPIGCVVTREAIGIAWPGDAVVSGLAWLLVASTLVSIAQRLRAAREPGVS